VSGLCSAHQGYEPGCKQCQAMPLTREEVVERAVELAPQLVCQKLWHTGCGFVFACSDQAQMWGRPLPRREWCVACEIKELLHDPPL